MNSHPYVRAYMAGIAVPTMFMLVVLCGFVIARFVFHLPVPIERGLVFPMALVPNVFGAWNMLYQRLHRAGSLSIGFHGALLPFVMAPFGYLVASSLGFLTLQQGTLTWFGEITVGYGVVAAGFCVAIIIYYLVWKHLVNFFNETLGIA
jgi:hypothetical protein